MRTRRLPALLLLAPFFAAACRPAPPPATARAEIATLPKPPVVAAPPAAAPGPSPLVSVKTLARVPEAFVLDGDVAEWGSLVPPPPPRPPRPARGESAPPPPSTSAMDAPSHVALVLSSAGVTLAAELDEGSQDGIWLGLGFGAPELPPIGYFQRGGGVMPLNCETDMGGEPLPADVQKACHETLAQHDAFTAGYEARFVRFFRLDRGGLSGIGEDGKGRLIEGAKAAVKGGEGRFTIEATLPTSALPRASSAPIDSIRLFARAADAPRPPAPADEEWVWREIPEPVSYEPFANLRALAFQAPEPIGGAPMSYQPGDPLELEVIGYARGSDGTALEPMRQGLYSPISTIGDVEIGELFLRRPALAILRKGEIVDTIETSGAPTGIERRNKELHMFFYDQYTSTDIWAESADWRVIGIKPSGEYTELLEGAVNNGPWEKDVEEFHSTRFDRFGIRGTPWRHDAEGEAPRPVEITWRYDATTRMYRPSTRVLPATKAKKAR
ncbi:hypothetical protein [Sorangium sp. So ce363]|uniref:hypothetical protein n=1 Tax=Sorangium sp. So ce363 TaxID=3133304 RepID=UPI003F623895